VRNYIDQSQEFALCAIALVYPIVTLVQHGRVRIAALFAVLALGFLANMMFVVVSRTALVTLPVLLVVFALLHLRWRAALVAGVATGVDRRSALGRLAASARDCRQVPERL